MSEHLREAWRRLASIETQVGEDKGIPVLHLDVSEGSEAWKWGTQQRDLGLWGGDTHSLVFIETEYEDLPRSGQRYLPACICGVSGGWMSFANRHKAALKFWQHHTQTEPWRLRLQQQGGKLTLYRGEGSHDHPSYYPKTGPDAGMAGGYWTPDIATARQFVHGIPEGKIYQIEVDESEFEMRGLYHFIPDPEVRARRQLVATIHTAAGKPAWEMTEAEFRAIEPRLVYHATTDRDRQILLTEGVQMANIPTNLARQRYLRGEFAQVAPGAGAGQGLYCARPIWQVFGYGSWIVGIEVSLSDLDFPPESDYYRQYGTIEQALNSNSGAMIVKDIPASKVHQMNAKRFTHEVHDAWEFATDPRWKAAMKTAADIPSHLPGWTGKYGIDAHGQMARLVSIGTSKVAHIAALDSYGDSFSEARRTGDLVTICDRYIRGGGWSSYGHYNAEDVDYVLNIAETKSFTSLCANCVRVAKANGINLL